MKNDRKFWFGIDGIDCTGKTSIINAIRSNSAITSRNEMLIFDEFTTAAPGEALRTIISEHRFLSIAESASSRWADTHLLLSDWCYKLECLNFSSARAAISDRSSISIVGYQAVRLKRQYPSFDITTLAEHIRQITELVKASMKNVEFFDVLLLSSPLALQERLEARNEAVLTENEIKEIISFQEAMAQAKPDLLIDTTDLSLSEVLNSISSAYLEKVSSFE